MELNDRIRLAQSDEQELALLISENKNFILGTASRVTGKFVTESDDAWSIALIAFHEAVKTFDESQGNFYSFAGLVMKRRLVDHIRSESRFSGEMPVAPETMDGEVEDDAAESALEFAVRKKEAEMAEESVSNSPGTTPMQDEIAALSDLLSDYGFSFFDLADCSPKADKTKKACAKAVAAILSDPELLSRMRASKTLPMKELEKISRVPRKILDRHRKYIIAAVEILNGEYPLLAEYMSYIRKAMVT